MDQTSLSLRIPSAALSTVHQDRGINYTKIKGSCQEMAKENFIPEEVSWNHNLHVIPTSGINLKPKTEDLLNLSNYKKIHSFVKILF